MFADVLRENAFCVYEKYICKVNSLDFMSCRLQFNFEQRDGLLGHGGEVVVVSDCVLAELNLL